MSETREALEQQLNDFDPAKRAAALDALLAMAATGEIALPEQNRDFNMHCHTFFSFNGYGYSPTFIAWKARCDGLYAMGLVDFDVLDGVDEFLAACRKTGIKSCAGMETRIYIPEFGDREINSPGEPGISYHMGAGFPSGAEKDSALVGQLRGIAGDRTRGMVERVNAFLDPVTVDLDTDLAAYVPQGNATERHVCMAYVAKGESVFPDAEERAAFWAEKLGQTPEAIKEVMQDGPAFQGLIRSKTMKSGGVGYVQPEGKDFPRLQEVNDFTKAAGGIPTMTWLDGTSSGEQAIEELTGLMVASGVAAANIIPDRNWNIKDAETKARKVKEFHAFAALCQSRDLPVIVGTEMNAFGQKFVDTFSAPEMAPLHAQFLEGTHIFHAHTLLQGQAGMGYVSDWAEKSFANAKEKNAFFAKAGELLPADGGAALAGITADDTPESVLAKLS